jgi:hypothetical protein
MLKRMIGIVYPINIGGKCKLFIFRMKSTKLIFSCFFPAFSCFFLLFSCFFPAFSCFFLLFSCFFPAFFLLFSCFFPAFNYRIFNIKIKENLINIKIEMGRN